jgi:hypothetical protein
MTDAIYRKTVLRTTMQVMAENPKHYLGMLSDYYFMVNETAQVAGLDCTSICLLFRKIRLNESWSTLADLFGSTEPEIQQVFTHSLRASVYYINQLIAWAKSDVVEYWVPDVFTGIYPKVQSVLHCLHVNTTKYLICYNPAGFITFVSDAFPSETSDEQIVSASGYIYTVPNDSQLLVVEGFEDLDSLVSLKDCTVVRVRAKRLSSGVTTTEMLRLRSYIFEMIVQIHDFKMCDNLCSIDPALVHPMIVCAAGLSNLLKCNSFRV